MKGLSSPDRACDTTVEQIRHQLPQQCTHELMATYCSFTYCVLSVRDGAPELGEDLHPHVVGQLCVRVAELGNREQQLVVFDTSGLRHEPT